MLFNSPDYLIFLTLVFFGFWALRKARVWRTLLLVGASCLFYMAWNRYLILLILYSTLLDWLAGTVIFRAKRSWVRRLFLILSLCVNLSVLGLFKYADFFLDSFNRLAEALHWPLHAPMLELILPVGISFYTFQTMSYTIDIYRGKLKPAQSLREFFLYVIFFPQLVAGPIVRAVDLIPQLEKEPVLDEREGLEGLYRIVIGLIKKVALADFLAINLVDRVFERPELFSAVEVAAGVYAYAFQIYLDFSAYSDIAIGSALLLGLKLPENFRTPYRAQNLQEFWRRWHISLSTWLRDYLYISLGGSRHGSLKTYRNLIITMLLGGLWHGAAWTFVLWGGLHGVGLAVTRVWQRVQGPAERSLIWRSLSTVLTFHYVCLGWIFFRAPTFDSALQMLTQLGTWTTDTANLGPSVLAVLGLAAVSHWIPEHWSSGVVRSFILMPAPARALALLIVAVGLKQIVRADAVPFIYFQF